MAYPASYDCDLPIWYMAMWAKETGLSLDWTWPNYFSKPVRLRMLPDQETLDLPLRTELFATYESFAWTAMAYFGIKHLPTLVAKTGGRVLQGSAMQVAYGLSADEFWPGDIIALPAVHAMVFIRRYGDPYDYVQDYQRPAMLLRTLQLFQVNAARLPPEERREFVRQTAVLREGIQRRLSTLRAVEDRQGYHTTPNDWDPAIARSLSQGQVPEFVPGLIVDSPGWDVAGTDPSRVFTGIVYPDLSSTNRLPHVASASGRQMWEWFRPEQDDELCDWRCETIVLRPFEDA